MSATGRNTRSSRQIIRKALPIEKANVHNEAGYLANANMLTTALTPSDPPCMFRIEVALNAAAKFKAKIIKATNEQTVVFNNDVNVAAGGLYIFDLLVHSGDTVNFLADQNETIQVLRVQEIAWAVQ